MFTRIVSILCLSTMALAGSRVWAEDAPDEQQELRQQMQQLGAQIWQNMQDKGISPQELFGDMREQWRSGGFDMNAMNQKLIEKGLIDKETIDKIQTKAQSVTLNGIKKKLSATDEEWKALQPKIQRVILAANDADPGNPARALLVGFMGAQLQKTDAAIKRQELQAVSTKSETTTAEYQEKLSALREATKKAKEELAAAQKELIELLTVKQEAALALMGLL